MQEPKPTPEQIAADLGVINTSANLKKSPVGRRIKFLHDLSTFATVRASQRWYRVWELTKDGWKFQEMQFGIKQQVS